MKQVEGIQQTALLMKLVSNKTTEDPFLFMRNILWQALQMENSQIL